MRILVVGAGVIGSVYGAKLAQAGHDVVLLARGHRLADLQTGGLPLVDAQSGQRLALPAPVVATVPPGDRYDLVVVPVRRDQLGGTLPVLRGMAGGPADADHGCDPVLTAGAGRPARGTLVRRPHPGRPRGDGVAPCRAPNRDRRHRPASARAGRPAFGGVS